MGLVMRLSLTATVDVKPPVFFLEWTLNMEEANWSCHTKTPTLILLVKTYNTNLYGWILLPMGQLTFCWWFVCLHMFLAEMEIAECCLTERVTDEHGYILAGGAELLPSFLWHLGFACQSRAEYSSALQALSLFCPLFYLESLFHPPISKSHS